MTQTPQAINTDNFGIGREYKLSAAFVAANADANGQVIIDWMPPGTIKKDVRIKHSQSFSGGGATAVTAAVNSLDPTQSPPVPVNAYGTAFDVFQPVSNTALETVQLSSGNVENFANWTPLAVKFTATGGTLGALTQGNVSVFARYITLSAGQPLRFDTSAQTPRAMPPY